MSSPVECLPVEVLELIAQDLDLPAHRHLRLASRQLHLLSLSTFAKRGFAELTTTLGSPSLDRLLSVSEHGYFCNVVTLLDIKLLTYRDYELFTDIDKVGIYPPPKRFAVVPGIKQEHISGEATLYNDVLGPKYPQCIADRLTRSLQGFSSLKTIRFRDYHSEPIRWQSVAISEGDQLFRMKCFQAVVDAIITSKIQLEEFSMAKKRRHITLRKCAGLAYLALQLPFSVLPSLQHSFAKLQSLTLSIVAAHNGVSRMPGWENGVSQFVACAPNLKNLTLSLDRKWLASHHSAAIIRSLALSCRLDELEKVHLTNCSLHEADIVKFLETHTDSLAYLSLSNVRLLTWNWETFFTSLQHLKTLRRLQIAHVDNARSPVTLRWRDPKKTKFVLDAEKSGRSIPELLEDLVTDVRQQELWVLEENDVLQ